MIAPVTVPTTASAPELGRRAANPKGAQARGLTPDASQAVGDTLPVAGAARVPR